MLNDFIHFSLWEIGHRWHDNDPNLSTTTNIPLSAQDTIRSIGRALIRCEIGVCNARGVQQKNPQRCPDFEDYWPRPLYVEKGDSRYKGRVFTQETDYVPENQLVILPENQTEDELWRQYQEFSESWGQRHWALVNCLEATIEDRIFVKEDLEAIHLDQGAIIKFCTLKELELPAFWFSQRERDEFASKCHPSEDEPAGVQPYGKLKRDDVDSFWQQVSPAQKTRIMCREIAINLWRKDGSRTIASIIEDPEIIRFAAAYGGKNTLRDWIKDLDPRPENERNGRPKKLTQ